MPLNSTETMRIHSLPAHQHPGPCSSTVTTHSPPVPLHLLTAPIPDSGRNLGSKQRAGPFKCPQTIEHHHPGLVGKQHNTRCVSPLNPGDVKDSQPCLLLFSVWLRKPCTCRQSLAYKIRITLTAFSFCSPDLQTILVISAGKCPQVLTGLLYICL